MAMSGNALYNSIITIPNWGNTCERIIQKVVKETTSKEVKLVIRVKPHIFFDTIDFTLTGDESKVFSIGRFIESLDWGTIF
jgi:hypothetical protein